MNLLNKIREKISPEDRKLNSTIRLNRLGISHEERVKIVAHVYSQWGRIFLEPMLLDMAIQEIKEEKLYGEEALKMLKSYINMPYASQVQPEILGN